MSKRKDIYYFVFYLEKDKNIQFSLRTTDYLISNILKYKILNKISEEMKKNNLEDLINLNTQRNLGVFKTKSGLNITIDNEEDEALVEDITQKTIRSIKSRKIKDVDSNIELKSTRKSKNNIRKHIDLFIKYFKSRNKNEKTLKGYIPKFEVLIDYFNYKKIYSLNDIKKRDCLELQTYLLNYPKNLNKYQELKDKDIFLLIDKSSKILDKYETLDKMTVDNYITRYKTLFNYLVEYDYLNNNYFLPIKNLKPKIENSISNFQNVKDMRQSFTNEDLELLLNNIQSKEIKDLIVFGILTGSRIHELTNLKVNDIIKNNFDYLIDIKKSKTDNGIRVVPLNSYFNYLIKELIKNKKDTDYLFFNDITINRDDKIQKRTMYQIRKYIKDKNKVFHSLRKNFTKLLYQTKIEELYIKLLLGHSLKDNLSFNTYNLSQVDNKLLIEQIEKLDFNKLFINTEYKRKIIIQKTQNNDISGINEHIF